MTSKPANYGVKFWFFCDALTGYCIQLKSHFGTDNCGEQMVKLEKKVVLELAEKLDVGQTVMITFLRIWIFTS